jgi:opacity protein-like surface antigen
MHTIRTLTCAAVLLVAACATAIAQEVPAPYKDVLTYLGRQGDFKANVLKVNIPRSDLSMTVAGVKTPTPFGFGGWIAMTKGTGMDVMMGDLVLTQDEVNPVMSALLDNGIEVTALHNHFFWDEPRVYYMHVHAHGAPMDLAKKVKPALDLIGKGKTAAAPASGAGTAPAGPGFDTAKIAQIAGHDGETSGAVYKITVGRDDLKMAEMGASINARMGLNTWAALVGTNEKAAIAGDVAMLANEVQPVLKALRANGLDVVAIHHHMTSTQPAVFFLHYWGTGPADTLAAGFKAALDQLGKGAAKPATKPSK